MYERLRALARRFLRQERAGHTLQPTALVNEAYVRLAGVERLEWQGRTHFLAVAAQQMRRVLVDHARQKIADKRGARRARVTLEEGMAVAAPRWVDVLALDRAIEKLARRNERRAKVVELRLFAGLEVPEIGEALAISERTVKEDWRMARAWLARELGQPMATTG